MKKLLKYIGYTLLTLVAFVLLYLIAAWGLSRITVAAESNTQHDIAIYLQGGAIHTDVVVPVKTADKDWSQRILYSNTRSGDTTLNYIAFGWGDKGFYLETPTWNDLKASTAFKAAFWLSTSAIHATYCKTPEEKDHCVRLVISKEQYQRLIAYIENSLQADSTGHPVAIGANVRYNNNDAFYEAKGRYSLFHTCNTWTNNALKASGQKACWWTPLESGIFYQYRR